MRTTDIHAPQFAKTILGPFNRARLGFPRHIFTGAGGIGDAVLCTTVLHEFKKRNPSSRIGMHTPYVSLFDRNPDAGFIIPPARALVSGFLHAGLDFTRLAYSSYDPATDRDTPLKEHILATICRIAGITGTIDLRPYFFLSPAELAAGRRFEKQIAIQSSSLGSLYTMANKAWLPDRFQWIASRLVPEAPLIQLGSPEDPPLEGALDLRGKTTLRESAAILANSLIFLGGVGFLMHLARAVDCRSVIVYGGRETPELTGYIANANLTGPTPCSPCWLRSKCDFGHECMNMIPAESALEAAQKLIALHGTPLETETANL